MTSLKLLQNKHGILKPLVQRPYNINVTLYHFAAYLLTYFNGHYNPISPFRYLERKITAFEFTTVGWRYLTTTFTIVAPDIW